MGRLANFGSDVMDEICVKVRLTNSVDEGLVRRGELPPERVRTYEAEAMVDTGAVRCVIPNPAHPDQPVTKVKTCFVRS